MTVERAMQGGVVTITLARPEKANALSDGLVAALQEGVDAAIADHSVHTLVFRGSGRHFCTGFDLSDLASETDATLFARFVRIEKLLQSVWNAPVRTIAVATGRTWGAGADLFASCDLRAATPGASFRFPGSAFGIVLGTRRLIELIGWDRARPLVTEGATLEAAAAVAAGLATHLVEGDPAGWLAAESSAPAIDRETMAMIRSCARGHHGAGDLAMLERSAARPGLAARIESYLRAIRA